ncbi:MAG: ABC transporter substrate-binding protein [Gammaproteobacteria bacterium]|nr:ABC transporter substrate-binding protein [Gammaproteobacteria bacterium]
MLQRRSFVLLSAAALTAPRAWSQAPAQPTQPPAQALADWPQTLAAARGQKVYWNAWAGDENTNAFIAWVGEQTRARYGVEVVHTRLKDTSEAVTRVIAEKSAGRDQGGTVDLIWINGPNFLAMKQQGLLYGPVTQRLPNFRFVDTTHKRSNLIDFTTPVDGFAVPWSLAQIVFIYDAARLRDAAEVPRSAPAMLDWARKHPGRLTHPVVSNFLGSTFLKQALVDLVADPAVLQVPATDASFAQVTAPLWTWYDALKPALWRQGRQFPDNGAAQRQLLNDGEIDITVSFHPAQAATWQMKGLLPDTARTFTFRKGTIGNTSFVAIPYNASHKEGALVVADFLIEPATQARAQDIRQLGNLNVLDLAKLSAEDRARFDRLTPSEALPTSAELGVPQLEPHASWMSRIESEWQKRYTR